MSIDAYEPSYWFNKGRYQDLYDKYFESLVPAMGKAKEEHVETLRIMSRIIHDRGNNGSETWRAVLGNGLCLDKNWQPLNAPTDVKAFFRLRNVEVEEEYAQYLDFQRQQEDDEDFDDDFTPDVTTFTFELLDGLMDSVLLWVQEIEK
jgi:hypothetical protein